MIAPPTSHRVAPRRHSRLRLSTFRALELATSVCGGRAFYRAAYLAAGRHRVREETVFVSSLPPALEGFRIAQLSDLHAGPFLARGDLADAVATVNALEPDVCAITGDLISHHWTDALLVADDLARVRARDGSFAVFGNHDYKDRLEGRIRAAFAERGIRCLENESVRIVRDGAAVSIVGLGDLEEARIVDLDAARRAMQPGDLEIVLCHNPARARSIARPGCACILSGHTHGTQLDLPGLRNLGPKHPGARVFVGETLLVVSRGLGVVGVPLRIGSPAEIVLVHLRAAPEPARSASSRAPE